MCSEYENALAFIDIAAMEARPMKRRFEVYGTHGSAILLSRSSPPRPFASAWMKRLPPPMGSSPARRSCRWSRNRASLPRS
ncbi:MAG: hypothetical protein R2911_39910 [Caldilineaceae bacterium]